MKKSLSLIFCLLAAITIGAELSDAADKSTPKAKQSWSARDNPNDYRIGSGDILEINTWKEPDFSREEILVRLDGKISFPLLFLDTSTSDKDTSS